MSDWQQSGQSGPIVIPPQAVVSPPPRSKWRVVKIVLVVMLVLGLMVSGMLNLLLLVFVAGGGASSGGGELEELPVSGKGQEKVAIVEISGVRLEGMGPYGSEGNYGFITKQIKQAADDRRVKGVVLEVDSPGGGVTASDVLAHKVAELAKKKPVVVSMKGVAASGGYYVSAGANKIYAQRTTITGSIGVIYTSVNVERLLDKIGVTPVVIKSGPLKDVGSMFRKMTPGEEAMLQGIINDSFERFKEVVSAGRKMSPEEVEKVATGAVFTAQEAKDLKLVDEIGYLEDAISGVKKLAGVERVQVIRYAQRPSLLRVLLRGQEQSGGKEVTVRLNAPGAEWPRAGLYYMWEPALGDRR